MENMTPTKEVLKTYHEIGHREDLRRWRKEVPKEARRAWLKSMTEEASLQKMSGDIEMWSNMIRNNLPEDKKESFDSYLRDYKRLVQEYLAFHPKMKVTKRN